MFPRGKLMLELALKKNEAKDATRGSKDASNLQKNGSPLPDHDHNYSSPIKHDGPSCSNDSEVPASIPKIGNLDESERDVSDSDASWEPNSNNEAGINSDSDVNSNATTKSLDISEAENSLTPKRWKKANPKKWKKNVRKSLCDKGEEYKDAKGRVRKRKTPKPVNCDKCRFKCPSKISNDRRDGICREYWNLGSFQRRNDFLLKHTKCSLVERPRARRQRKKEARKRSIAFYLPSDNQKVRVCKKFFTTTLAISHGPIDTAIKGISESGASFEGTDMRGKHPPWNKISTESMNNVKTHIEKFPVMESHYTRKDTKRKYLDPKLSIRKMHELYSDDCKISNPPIKPESEDYYRRIFGEHYNLSFFKPKKDLCVTCFKYTSASPNEQISLKASYDAHILRKTQAQDAKTADTIRAKNDSSFLSATMDLQSVLQLPSAEASLLYYVRKLCVYNLTIYEAAPPNNGFCFCWPEYEGKRGSIEIGSIILTWLRELPSEVKEVSIFSDTCSGQNRNKNVAAALLYAVSNYNVNTITQKFLESGHSHMECDSMHSAVETERKNTPVYSMFEWCQIFNRARRGNPYKVKQLTHKDFLDLNTLGDMLKNRTKDENSDNVNWLLIKRLQFNKSEPGVIKYSYAHNDEMKSIYIYGRGRPKQMPKTIPNAYKETLPITAAKKKDLVVLCDKGIIPQELHSWYKSLKASKTQTVDLVPEPGILDSDTEDEED